jgi:hypothetical protein
MQKIAKQQCNNRYNRKERRKSRILDSRIEYYFGKEPQHCAQYDGKEELSEESE